MSTPRFSTLSDVDSSVKIMQPPNPTASHGEHANQNTDRPGISACYMWPTRNTGDPDIPTLYIDSKAPLTPSVFFTRFAGSRFCYYVQGR